MKNFIFTEFKRNSKSLILWTAIVGGLALLMLSLYPAFKEAFASLEDLLSVYPEAFLEAFGLGEGGLDMSDPYGWYGTEGYLFVLLIGGSYAAILGSSILSKEEDDKTVEFLLSRPISRTKVLLGKYVVVIINLLILNTIMCLLLLLMFTIYNDVQLYTIVLLSFGPFVLQLIFASIGFFISTIITKSRMVMSISLGLTIGMYAVDLISKLTTEFKFLKHITPYEYINAIDIIVHNHIDSFYLLLSVGIILLSLFGAWRIYTKKDITV